MMRSAYVDFDDVGLTCGCAAALFHNCPSVPAKLPATTALVRLVEDPLWMHIA